jgi:hypothetical protein
MLVWRKVHSCSSSSWKTLWSRSKKLQGHRLLEPPRLVGEFQIVTPCLHFTFHWDVCQHTAQINFYTFLCIRANVILQTAMEILRRLSNLILKITVTKEDITLVITLMSEKAFQRCWLIVMQYHNIRKQAKKIDMYLSNRRIQQQAVRTLVAKHF